MTNHITHLIKNRLIDLGKQQNITEIEQTSPSKLPTSHSESNVYSNKHVILKDIE